MLPNPDPCVRCGYASRAGGELCGACGGNGVTAASRPAAGPLRGAGAFFRGLGFLLTRSQTKRYAILPAVIAVVVFAVAYALLDHATTGLRESAVSAEWIPAWLRTAVGALLRMILFFAFLAVVWIAGAPMVQLIASPFLDVFAARVDREKLGTAPAAGGSWFADAGFTVLQALASAAVSIALTAAALAAAFIPAVNVVLTPLLLAAAYGFAGLDTAASRRRWTLGQKVAVMRGNAAAMLAFGGAALAASFVPGIFIIFAPVAALGGALLLYELDLRPARRRGMLNAPAP